MSLPHSARSVAPEVTVVPVPGESAEDVVVAMDGSFKGSVFTGTQDGSIWRVSPDGTSVDRVASTLGHPLGLEMDAEGRLIVMDCERGVLRVDPSTGYVEVLVDTVAGHKMVFCNNGAVASDGTIWFSDSSTKYDQPHWKADFIEGTRTGRLLRRTPNGEVEVVLDGLAFANGVALAADESFVVVAETGARTLVRYWLAGERAGSRDFLVPALPGYPDNISRGSDGLIWVALASPKDPTIEGLQRAPMVLRKLATKLPERYQPAPKRTVRAQAYDAVGTLVHDLDLSAESFHMVTGVRENDGTVWFGSLAEPAIAFATLTQ